MNCANHRDRERSAFCQNCGKPLCGECVRTIGTSVFCEPCYAARAGGAAAPGYPPGAMPPGYPPGIPNPGLAALLGFIPGVGAMYNEQYAKGIVHLLVFAILVSLSHDVSGIFGLFVMGWIVYQVIEAHHTARARRDGTPLPNPFGLNDLSERLGFGKAWPGGAAGPYAAPFTAGPIDPAGGSGPGAAGAGRNPDAGAAAGGAYAGAAAGPNVPPYGYGAGYSYSYRYAPPVSNWGAPQDAYGYGVPPMPPVTPVSPMPPVPPYVDTNAPGVPYGPGAAYGPGVPDGPGVAYGRRFPTGAIWLIGLGCFFLLANSGLFHLRGRFFGPLLLIAVGVWTFVRRMTCERRFAAPEGGAGLAMRLVLAAKGAVWMLLIGLIWLADALHILTWSRSWPLLLIAGGIMLFLRRTMVGWYGMGGYGAGGFGAGGFGAGAAGPYGGYPGGYSGGAAGTPPVAPATSTAIVPAEVLPPAGDGHDSSREGR